MKTKLTILLILISTVIFSQKKFEISVTGGGNYMFIPDSLNQNNLISGKLAYQTGLMFSYELIKHIKIGTGAKYTTLSWSESYPPETDLTDFIINVQYKYKLFEFPFYVQFEPFIEKKISPYIRTGGFITEINEKTGSLIGTEPSGNEQNYFAQMFNYTFKGEYTFVRNMYGFFINTGFNYNIFKSFYVGLNGEIRRYFYYDFNDKRSNYTANLNITTGYRF